MSVIGNDNWIGDYCHRNCHLHFPNRTGATGEARFEFVEDEAGWNRPFPTHGDLYQFELKEFAGAK